MAEPTTMTSAREAIAWVKRRAQGPRLNPHLHVTLNFHPDLQVSSELTIRAMQRDGLYRSQFETGTSNGGLTAHVGSDRWLWESDMFGGAYDHAPPNERPKYGALNHKASPFGGSPRFGSCHFRLLPETLHRTTFCYPDSFLKPKDFGLAESMALIALAERNALNLDAELDNYIEAHVHGPLPIAKDCEALVLDPSYCGTEIEAQATKLGCPIEWHTGFSLDMDKIADCASFRGQAAADALANIAFNGRITPRQLGQARSAGLDYQVAKWAWHCIVKFGQSL